MPSSELMADVFARDRNSVVIAVEQGHQNLERGVLRSSFDGQNVPIGSTDARDNLLRDDRLLAHEDTPNLIADVVADEFPRFVVLARNCELLAADVRHVVESDLAEASGNRADQIMLDVEHDLSVCPNGRLHFATIDESRADRFQFFNQFVILSFISAANDPELAALWIALGEFYRQLMRENPFELIQRWCAWHRSVAGALFSVFRSCPCGWRCERLSNFPLRRPLA